MPLSGFGLSFVFFSDSNVQHQNRSLEGTSEYSSAFFYPAGQGDPPGIIYIAQWIYTRNRAIGLSCQEVISNTMSSFYDVMVPGFAVLAGELSGLENLAAKVGRRFMTPEKSQPLGKLDSPQTSKQVGV